jgi:hypothetical protein
MVDDYRGGSCLLPKRLRRFASIDATPSPEPGLDKIRPYRGAEFCPPVPKNGQSHFCPFCPFVPGTAKTSIKSI